MMNYIAAFAVSPIYLYVTIYVHIDMILYMYICVVIYIYPDLSLIRLSFPL